MKKFLSLVLALVLTMSLVVVPANATEGDVSVTLNHSTATLFVGDTETLTATVAPENATNKTVTWASDDETVASVDQNGNVTAVAAGTAKITATSTADNTKSATCTVTVSDKYVLTANVDKSTLYFNGTEASSSKTTTVTATLKEKGDEMEDGSYEIVLSEDSSLLDTTGTTISVAPNASSAQSDITVTVTAKVDNEVVATGSVKINVADRYSIDVVPARDMTVTVTKGNSKTLTAPVLKDALSPYPVSSASYTLTYGSDRTTIADVDRFSGVVTGIAVGNTEVKATINYGGKAYKTKYAVTVEPIKLAIELDKVENGNNDYLYASNLESAVVAALKMAVPSYSGNKTVNELKVSANNLPGGKLYKKDGTTAITPSDNLVGSDVHYTKFAATPGYLGKAAYTITAVIDGAPYTGTMTIPVVSAGDIDKDIYAYVTSSNSVSFELPSGYDTLYYKQGSVSSYDGLWTSATYAYQNGCLLYTSPSPRDISGSRMPSSA